MNLDQRILSAALRTNFMTFMHRVFLTLNPGKVFLLNWHHLAIAWCLQRVMAGEIKRLIINMPPRYLKSEMVSVALPAFWLGLQPRRRIFGISYNEELAAKLAADFRSVVEAPWYRPNFPQMRI